jgi:hypothetical protein
MKKNNKAIHFVVEAHVIFDPDDKEEATVMGKTFGKDVVKLFEHLDGLTSYEIGHEVRCSGTPYRRCADVTGEKRRNNDALFE